MPCDRGAAREARAIIARTLTPLAAQHGADVALACPLHPEHDHLLPHELQKKAVTQWQWRCGVCGKLFRSERYLDMHMERKHPDLLNSNATTCLAEYCDVLQCPGWLGELQRKEREQPRQCQAGALEARQHFCQHLMHDCFAARPGIDPHMLFEHMEDHFCRPLSCTGRQVLLREGSTLPVLDGARDGVGAAYYVFGGLLIAMLGVLYTGMLCRWSETRSTSSELHPRRQQHRGWQQRSTRWYGAERQHAD